MTDYLPIAVDLDGTVVKTDTLLESVLLLLSKNLVALAQIIVWLGRGKVYCKQAVGQRTKLAVADLPYTEALLTYLAQQRRLGHELYLVTAAHPNIARAVAEHLRIFTGVIAADTVNLAGPAKAAALTERFGPGGYLYAANSMVDVPVWRQSAGAIVVNANVRVRRAAAAVTSVVLVIPRTPTTVAIWVRLLRCHQWVKNTLVLVPMIAAHLITVEAVLEASLTFVSFCFVSSGVYVLNDVLDLATDRRHPTKRRRPLAAGEVSLQTGLALMPLLGLAGVMLGWWVSPAVAAWLMVYLIITTWYSFYLKRLVIIDVVTLGLLYTLRIFAGAAAVAVPVSAWLLVFSLFLFMSLALVKRFTELRRVAGSAQTGPSTGQAGLPGRGYQLSNLAPIGGFGVVSGYLSVLVLGLYITSSEVTLLYRHSVWLWWLLPVLFYWISRLWVLAYRNQVPDDPVIFAMRDPISYIILIVSLAIVFVAT